VSPAELIKETANKRYDEASREIERSKSTQQPLSEYYVLALRKQIHKEVAIDMIKLSERLVNANVDSFKAEIEDLIRRASEKAKKYSQRDPLLSARFDIKVNALEWYSYIIEREYGG